MSENEKLPPPVNLKHRLVGAVMLVMAAVIVLPLILREQEPPAELKAIGEISGKDASASGDAMDGGGTTPRMEELGPRQEQRPRATPGDSRDGGGRAASGTAAGAVAGTAAGYVPPATAPDGMAEAKPTTPIAKESAAVPAPAKAVPVAARPAKGWVVQVGVFANAANAAKLADTLKGQGHEVMLDNITHQDARRLRVRVGPFADKTQAQRAQAKIQQATGVAGAVLGYP